MVRDIRSILSSMEKLYRANPEKHQNIQNHAQMTGTITEKRVDIWLNSQPIGLALERLYQMIREGIDKNVFFIRAEDLTQDPTVVLDGIYKYLEISSFAHDFNNVEQVTKEDDEIYGHNDLHKIRTKVERLTPDYRDILGVELSNNVNERVQWYQSFFGYK